MIDDKYIINRLFKRYRETTVDKNIKMTDYKD